MGIVKQVTARALMAGCAALFVGSAVANDSQQQAPKPAEQEPKVLFFNLNGQRVPVLIKDGVAQMPATKFMELMAVGRAMYEALRQANDNAEEALEELDKCKAKSGT